MTERPRLTRHVVRAALHVAAVLGEGTSQVVVARESYWHRATGGQFSAADLRLGEDALVEAGFVRRDDDHLTLTPLLAELVDADGDDALEALAVALLAARHLPTDDPEATEETVTALIDDPDRREEVLLALGRRFDDALLREIGAIGEELVVAAARDELEALGHHILARQVRRVSLISDQLGYDVSAPRIAAGPRLLEVKATAGDRGLVFLSRNEADTGQRFADWSLVLCTIGEVEARTGTITGWCQHSDLAVFLPADPPGGRWESVSIEVSRLELRPGLPRPAG